MPAVVYRVTSGASPLALPPGAPPRFRALVDACLAREPSRRPTFSQVLSTLDALLAREEEAAAAAGDRQPAAPPAAVGSPAVALSAG